jgi:hypothetical protein
MGTADKFDAGAPAHAGLPDHWVIHAYRCPDAPEGFQWVAHWLEGRRDRAGNRVFSFQAATAHGRTDDEATGKLRAFLQAEIAKKAKRRANAEAFGERVRARHARTRS